MMSLWTSEVYVKELRLYRCTEATLLRALTISITYDFCSETGVRCYWLGAVSGTKENIENLIRLVEQQDIDAIQNQTYHGVGDIAFAVLVVGTGDKGVREICVVHQHATIDNPLTVLKRVVIKQELTIDEEPRPCDPDGDPDYSNKWRLLASLFSSKSRR